jgi:rhamnulokinase
VTGTAHVAVDLGATSGRVVLGVLDGHRVDLEEVHRFPAATLGAGPALAWDVPALLAETVTGLARAARALDGDLRVRRDTAVTVGVTAWGVDAGLLGADGTLLAPVRHYRAARDRDRVAGEAVVAAAERYRRTGVLPQTINTAYRLGRVVHDACAGGDVGAALLPVPDLVVALLSGQRAVERSSAGTTGLVDRRTGTWDRDLVAAGGGARCEALLPPVVPDGVVAGALLDDVAARTGAGRDGRRWQVVRVAGHDTASAALAVGDDRRTAFLSCGTWSLLGVAREEPVVTPAALAAGLTNEAGALGSWLLMRNLTGLWLLEQAARSRVGPRWWPGVAEAVAAASALGPTHAAVDVTDPGLVHAPDVVAAVRSRCAAAGLPPPTDAAAYARCVLQGLALTYRRSLEALERATGEPVEAVRLVGGGTRLPLLARLTADACRRPVDVGPAEATSLGSVLGQALATGALADLPALRRVAAASVRWATVRPDLDPDVARYWAELDATVPPAAGHEQDGDR